MVIPINEVSLDSAVEKILPEVTDTVDNIDDRTPWSLNLFRLMSASSFLLMKEKQQNIE